MLASETSSHSSRDDGVVGERGLYEAGEAERALPGAALPRKSALGDADGNPRPEG